MNRIARIISATAVVLAVVVPTFAGVASAAPADTITTTGETTITVRAGDSLAGLAWRHSVRLSTLLRANSLDLTSVIHPGDTLVIPAGASITPGGQTIADETTPAAPAASTNPAAGPTMSSYVVEAGDALSLIAWRNGIRLSALLQANGLTVTSLILPGQRLQLPPATRPIPASATTVAATPAGAGAPAAAVAPIASTAPAAEQGSSLQTMLSYATAQVGAPYRFFSAGPDAFDCSGLVVAAFRQIGISVPHQSRALARIGSSVDWLTESISAGDLVFTSATNDPDMITHVGIALDSRRWVQAIGVGRTVTIGSLPSDSRIMAVQRIAIP